MKSVKRLFLFLLVFALLASAFMAFPAGAHDIPVDDYNTVYMAVKDFGVITIDLYPEQAPITVANFKDLVWHDFYDGLTFHRIIESFMIQGGDPQGTGMGGSDENIKGEFSYNNVDTGLKHVAGTISMARQGHPDEGYVNPDAIPFEEREPYYNSASSQFFIVTQTSASNSMSLDGKYAAFGQVTEGMDIVHAIAAVETDANQRPIKPVTITAITFDKAEAEASLNAATSSKAGPSLTWLWITLGTVGACGAIALFILLPVLSDQKREKQAIAEREEKRKAAKEAAAAAAKKKYKKRKK